MSKNESTDSTEIRTDAKERIQFCVCLECGNIYRELFYEYL